MKKIFLTAVLSIIVCMSVMAQKELKLVFTGGNQNYEWIPLSRIMMENLTQGWQETIYYPDTIICMENVGIDDYLQKGKVRLFQNVPNPFDGKTDFTLQLDEDQTVLLEIFDMGGKLVSQYERKLPQGTHAFRALMSSPQTYLLNAKTGENSLHIKMVNTGNGGENRIEYLGLSSERKSDIKGNAHYPWAIGDEFNIVGYANLCGKEYESDTKKSYLQRNESYKIIFSLPLPEIISSEATGITGDSALLKAKSDVGDCSLIEQGFCYGTAAGRLDKKVKTTDVSNGEFQCTISNLKPMTTYYYKAYAKSQMGTGYSKIYHFRTTASLPLVITNEVTGITPTTAVCGGNVKSDGARTLTACGVCWSTNENPTILDDHTSDGTSTGPFTSSLTNLISNTTYYVRAYATNEMGTAYGEQKSFTTLPSIPLVITESVKSITTVSAISGGDVIRDGGADVIDRGVCWSTNQNPTLSDSYISSGKGVGSFVSDITNLNPGTTYYVRAYATNSLGTAYGNQESFKSLSTLPSVITSEVMHITSVSAVSGGEVTSDGGATVTARGICWSTNENPTLSDNHTVKDGDEGRFVSGMLDLNPSTTYYVRAYATNSEGTTYGNQVNFTTEPQFICGTDTVKDYDGNTYHSVQIGQQCWMKENMKTTHYSDGTAIEHGHIGTMSMPKEYAFAYLPGNKEDNVGVYGYLYNWKAAMRNLATSNTNESGIQGVCPTGWHLPSEAEWDQLVNYLGGQSDFLCDSSNTSIAKALASTEAWTSNTTACAIGNAQNDNNATGFSAVPAGLYNSSFEKFGSKAIFWTSTQQSSYSAYYRSLDYDKANVIRNCNYKTYGYSVRCVKDKNLATDGVPCPGTPTLTDYDNNIYNTVQIGQQCWMKENLKTTHYSDGTLVKGLDVSYFFGDKANLYFPDEDSSNVDMYGYLYNWFALCRTDMSPSSSQGICPEGWHIPSYDEWSQMTDYLSSRGEYVCGDDNENIAKTLALTTGWHSGADSCCIGNTLNNNNLTGFSALPAGGISSFFDGENTIKSFGNTAKFWSTGESGTGAGYYRLISYNSAKVSVRTASKADACSVRCLRD